MAKQISFVQSGGFIGLTLGCELDSDLLSPEAAAELDGLLSREAAAGRRDSSARPASAAARDVTTYSITVTTSEGSQVFTFDDASVPAEVEQLLDQLRHCAKARRPPR